ncbi:MAG: Flp family type IVb pilin [Alphaproteobacteria bacterium]|nr:Flp family type IVb pilin [Alphaproteobacteria bacterium]
MQKINTLLNMLGNKTGAAKIEYVLLVALISIVAMAALSDIGTNMKAKFEEITTELA